MPHDYMFALFTDYLMAWQAVYHPINVRNKDRSMFATLEEVSRAVRVYKTIESIECDFR
jgi:hypothetical protein